MKYFQPILIILLITAICLIAFNKNDMDSKTKIEIRDVKKLKDKIVFVKDTITRIETRLQKAKEIHDTIQIIKEQDTLIKYLNIETRIQDTVILKQDTIIRQLKNKSLKGEIIGFGVGFVVGFLTSKITGK
jgi:hypothetical protein